jgi:hypothetical protein
MDRLSPYEYMRQIRIAAEANIVSMEAMLTRKIPILMIHEAANWFAVNKRNFISWDEFHRLFMEEYNRPNYKQQLMSDLEQRRHLQEARQNSG